MKILIRNLSRKVMEKELGDIFRAFGKVDSVLLVRDRNNQASKGFGFIHMPDDEEAEAAIKALDGKNINAEKVRVKIAIPREEPVKKSFKSAKAKTRDIAPPRFKYPARKPVGYGYTPQTLEKYDRRDQGQGTVKSNASFSKTERRVAERRVHQPGSDSANFRPGYSKDRNRKPEPKLYGERRKYNSDRRKRSRTRPYKAQNEGLKQEYKSRGERNFSQQSDRGRNPRTNTGFHNKKNDRGRKAGV